MDTKAFALSVKVIVKDGDDRCLLIQRALTSRGNPGFWDLPGGKLDPGEQFDVGLLREVREETGLPITLLGLLGSAQSESHNARVIYIIMEARGEGGKVTLSEEHEDFRWVDAASVTDLEILPQFKSLIYRALGAAD